MLKGALKSEAPSDTKQIPYQMPPEASSEASWPLAGSYPLWTLDPPPTHPGPGSGWDLAQLVGVHGTAWEWEQCQRTPCVQPPARWSGVAYTPNDAGFPEFT